MDTINLAQQVSTFSEHSQPRPVGQDMRVVGASLGYGEFVWHKHYPTGGFFMVL